MTRPRGSLVGALLWTGACASTSPPPPAPPAPPAPASEVEAELDPREAACGAGVLAPPAPTAVDAPAPPSPSGPPPQASRVAEIAVEGAKRLDEAAVRAAIQAGPGMLDSEVVAADLRRLWAIEGVGDVSVIAEGAEEALRLVYRIRERPAVGEVFAQPPDGADDLVTQLNEARFVDPGRIHRWTRQTLEALHEDGHRRAAVKVTAREVEPQVLDLCVHLERGPRATIRSWEVTGVEAFSPRELAQLWDTPEGSLDTVGGALHEDRLEHALLLLLEAYYDRGHVEAEVSGPEISISQDGEHVDVKIAVEEGPVYRLGAVSVEGPAEEATYERLVGPLKSGEVFQRSRVKTVIEAIERHHRDEGQAVTVRPETQADRDQQRIDLLLLVEPHGR